MDLAEAKILRRGGKNTQKNYTKNFNEPDSHDGVVTHLDQTSWNVKSNGP